MASWTDNRGKRNERSGNAPTAPSAPSAPAAPQDPLAAVALSKSEVEVLASVAPVDEKPVDSVAEEKPVKLELPAETVHSVRVLADGKVMLGACVHRFKAGNVLHANHYETRVFKQIIDALKTEPVKG